VTYVREGLRSLMLTQTGDEAEMNAEGYVKITGRLKDLIIRGGENIHPLEIENCILGNPGVNDVSVVGVKDDRYGESVVAFVVRKSGRNVTAAGESNKTYAATIQEWVKGRLSKHLGESRVHWRLCRDMLC